MSYAVYMLLAALGLFVGMLLLLEVGRRIGKRRISQDADNKGAGLDVVEGAVFGLLHDKFQKKFTAASVTYNAERVNSDITAGSLLSLEAISYRRGDGTAPVALSYRAHAESGFISCK